MSENKYKPGDKFVIEIAGVMKEVDGERCVRLADDTVSPHYTAYRMKGFNTLLFDERGLSMLKPYEKSVQDTERKAYRKGLSDAWTAADMLFDLTPGEIREMFNQDICANSILDAYDPEDVIFAIKLLLEKEKVEKKVNVGDVFESIVEPRKGFKIMVTKIHDNGDWSVLQQDGEVSYIATPIQKKCWKKTGMNINIRTTLDLMKVAGDE